MNFFLKSLLLILLTSTCAYGVDDFVANTEKNFAPSHSNRFSFLLGVNPSLSKSTDVANFLFSYANRIDSFWIEGSASTTSGLFSKMTLNNQNATGSSDSELKNSRSTLTSFGLGVARESKYAQALFSSNNLYEIVATDLTYNIFKESVQSKSFNGVGLLAKFGLYKKTSDYFSFGAQFVYHLAVVKRAPDSDSETSSMRSLTLSHLTIGLDLSFFL